MLEAASNNDCIRVVEATSVTQARRVRPEPSKVRYKVRIDTIHTRCCDEVGLGGNRRRNDNFHQARRRFAQGDRPVLQMM